MPAPEIKLPFRFGRSDPGTGIRPAIFYIVEDIVAVDGAGFVSYREAFNARYSRSPLFRDMIRKLSMVWCLSFYVIAGWFTVLVLTLPVKAVYAVYAVVCTGSFSVAGLLAVWTIYFVKGALREERVAEEEGRNRNTNGAESGRLISSEGERAPLLSSGA
ncbi:uncharacterized protein RAG0_14558 [Rhynchosporium agropyri]|uniref:Uncharacterized protein n=1 Tax=Rhynchosporium agropyri TaxID=914238 RepID=A0A1E1LHH5_9HELO|nr:uncharacterized protein RAG0_14558 [Rhynchosporium agropyri]